MCEGKWWTLLTTMLVHWDAKHLLSNLQAMVVAGWPVKPINIALFFKLAPKSGCEVCFSASTDRSS